MAGKIVRMSKVKQMLLLHQQGMSNRKIAGELSIDKETVNNYIRKIKSSTMTIAELLKLDDPILEGQLFAGSPAYSDPRMSDFLERLPYFKEQLTNKHVTREELWQEYRVKYSNGYAKSQFYYHLKQNLVASKSQVTILTGNYNPAEKLFVDYAGDRLSYIDEETGEEVKVQTFVATLPYSDYAFCICVPSQRVEDFIYALRMCLEHLGGVPSIVVPDNLKAAVIKADKYEPELNKVFEDMGNHYGFVSLPARSYHPKDKALVENQVKLIYHRVYAKMRNMTFYSLKELNEKVAELVQLHNRTRMQQRGYTREERFHSAEKSHLKVLPDTVFEPKSYAKVRIQPNGTVLISKDKHYYSVPYTLIGRTATIIFTRSIIKVYVDNKCVATHLRSSEYGHTTNREHLSPESLHYLDRSPSYYKEKAAKCSPELHKLFTVMYDKKKSGVIDEFYYRTCEKMLKLYKKYDAEIFNAACILCRDNNIFKGDSMENIINTLISQKDNDTTTNTSYEVVINNHKNTRGKDSFK